MYPEALKSLHFEGWVLLRLLVEGEMPVMLDPVEEAAIYRSGITHYIGFNRKKSPHFDLKTNEDPPFGSSIF
jgi:hypothetical protein